MSRTLRFLSTAALLAFGSGAAMAQMAGGGMGGAGSTGMMSGQASAQMMGGQMMKSGMTGGMAGTMTQMHQVMEKMAGSMGQAMDMKTMNNLAGMMDDLAGLMKQMAAQMRSGKMDDAMLKRMNERVSAMGRALDQAAAKGSK